MTTSGRFIIMLVWREAAGASASATRNTLNSIMVANIPISVEQIEAFCRKWNLREFALFGSVLREDFRPDSDVDVLITFGAGAGMTIESYIAMGDELRAMFGHPVDLVEKHLVRNPFRRHEILTTRRILYAA